MKGNVIRFQVEEYEFRDKDLIVRGRCTEGTLKEGCVFTYSYPIIFIKEAGHTVESKRGKVSNVNLKIKEIHAYGRVVEMIDAGLTGELVLTGEGGEFLEIEGEISAGGTMEGSKIVWM